VATGHDVCLNGSNRRRFHGDNGLLVRDSWCARIWFTFCSFYSCIPVMQSGPWPTLTMLLVVKCRDGGLQRFPFLERCEADDGSLVQEEKLGFSHRRDENDDVAPFVG